MLFNLRSGDLVRYIDLKGRNRQLIYIRETGLVRAIVGQDYCPQQQFLDEKGAIVHIPVNAWEIANINPWLIHKADYGF